MTRVMLAAGASARPLVILAHCQHELGDEDGRALADDLCEDFPTYGEGEASGARA